MDPIAARKRALDQDREFELLRVEKSYKDDIARQEQVKGEAVRKARQEQGEEIARVQEDVAHKVTLASQSADQQLRNLQQQTQSMVQEAAKRFQQKSGDLVKAQREMDDQRNKVLTQHADEIKKLALDNEARQKDLKASYGKSMTENEVALSNRVESMRTQQRSDISKLESDQKREKEKVISQGQIELAREQARQENLKNELQFQEKLLQSREHEKLESLQKQNSDRYMAEQVQGQGSVENLRQTNLRRMTELKDQGDRNYFKQKQFYEAALTQNAKDNQTRIGNEREKTQNELNAIDQNFTFQKKVMERDYYKKLHDLRDRQDLSEKEAADRTEGIRKKANEQYLAQSKDIREKRDFTIKNLTDALRADSNRIMDLGQKAIESNKLETAQAIQANLNRSSDPFYRIRNLGISVSEQENGTLLSLNQPEHEKDSIRITYNAGSLTLTGNRRYEEKVQEAPGHVLTTNAYQSYSETIPLKHKVDPARATRTYDSGVLKIFLPKA